MSRQYTIGLQSECFGSFKFLFNKLHSNDIPVISPALTDGSLGDMLFFHSFKNPGLQSIYSSFTCKDRSLYWPGLVVDILGDLRLINKLAMRSVNTGLTIILFLQKKC